MRTWIIGTVLAALTLLGAHARAQTPSAFTYQGELREAGAVADGLYDFRFVLFDVPSGGSAVTAVLCAEGVLVQGGRFTVELDFGGLDFQTLWMEMQVRPATGLGCGNGLGLTTLAPRQKLTPTPFAKVAGFAMDTQTLGGNGPFFYRQASNLLGTIPSAGLSGIYTQPITLNNSANLFAGNGSGLIALNAANLSIGTVPDGRLSANIAQLNRANAFTAPASFASTSSFAGAATFGGSATFNGPVILPVTTRVMSLSAHDFSPGNSGFDYSNDSGVAAGTASGQTPIFLAPIHLPSGAVITQFDAFVLDNDTVRSIAVSLLRVQLNTSGQAAMATTSTTPAGASPNVQVLTDASVSLGVIDNTQFAYCIRAIWTTPATPSTISLRGGKITYTVTSPLP